jgi:hypothetical protein
LRGSGRVRTRRRSGSGSSVIEMSNDSVVVATSTSAAPSPISSPRAIRKPSSARPGITTPLGRPVEPEV